MAIVYHTPIQLIPDPDPTDPTAVVNVGYLTAHAGKKHAEDMTGDGTKTAFDIDHSLDTTDVTVAIWSLPGREKVEAGVTVVDADNVTVTFADAPATGTNFRVVVMG